MIFGYLVREFFVHLQDLSVFFAYSIPRPRNARSYCHNGAGRKLDSREHESVMCFGIIWK